MSTTSDNCEADRQEVAASEDRLVGMLNGAGAALLLSVGHRTGLLDALAETQPASSSELAGAAGCHERYVREWLGGLTVSGLVEHDPVGQTYAFAPGAADLLTRNGTANLAVFMQYVAVLASVEDGIVRCFRDGGGLGYEHFPRFQEVMAEDSAQTVLAALDEAILPLVPGLRQRLDDGIDMVDVGCGRGRAITQLGAQFPRSRFLGVDLDQHALHWAREAAAGLGNVSFQRLDATRLAEELPAGSADLVLTFDAIHDQGQPAAMLAGIRGLLRPDGVYLAQDIASTGCHHDDRDHPLGPFLYTISTMHCLTVSLSAGGTGLGTMWGIPLAEQYLREAGFSEIDVHELPHDPQNVYYVAR